MSPTQDTKRVWAFTGTILASVMLIMAGLWQALEGLAALQSDEFLNPKAGYTYRFSIETWGWTHMVVGVFCIVIGALVYTGKAIYRKVAIVIVAFSMITNFLFLPYYSSWPLLILGIDILVIWSLATYKDPVEEAKSWAPLVEDE